MCEDQACEGLGTTGGVSRVEERVVVVQELNSELLCFES